MKIWRRLLALCAALTLMAGCACAEEAQDPGALALATVDGVEITAEQADEIAYLFYYYGYTQTYPDYDMALDYLIQQQVIQHHLREAGYDQFTDEERAAFANEANAEWEALLGDYVENNLTEDTQEARDALRAQAIADYEAAGYGQADMLEEMLLDEAYSRLENDLTDGYEPTDAEIDEIFQQYGAQYRQQYENDVALYEYYTNYYNYESWYVPEGYRAVLHILLEVDDELLSAYMSAQAAYEEAESAETPDEQALSTAKTAMDDAKAAVLASCQGTIDEIYERLEKGESFQSLIAEFGTDPGMQDEQILSEGYAVHADSILYDQAFTEGAFQERMQKPGDYSDPVVGQFGVHILYYLSDVPGGLIMTDDIRAEIEEFLISEKLDSAYSEQYPSWEAQVTIVYNEENLAALKASLEAEESAQ